MDIKEHLKDLVRLNGPTAFEDPVREHLRETWADLVDEFRVSKLGSAIGIRHGSGPEPRPKILLAGHIDEIGMMVTDIKEGFLTFTRLGGPDKRVMPGQFVTVLASEGEPLTGYIGMKPPHITPRSERGEYPDMTDLFIDVGLPHEEVTKRVQIGDAIVIESEPVDLLGGNVASKAMDDRAGAATVTAVLQELTKYVHQWDVIAVGSAQEEDSAWDARQVAFQEAPDLAIAFDVTFGSQPGVGGSVNTYDLGSGPTLTRGAQTHPKYYEALKKVADDLEIKIGIEATPSHTGTDGWPMQITRAGVPTAVIGIPCKNMHTPVEMVNPKDIERAGRWVAAFIAALEPDFVEKTLIWDEEDEEEKEAEG